ncbi:hypothetical protein BDR26DRAFT_859075, partial [Obelidium mucronatum]
MPRLQKTWILPTLYFRALEGPLKFGFLRVYAFSACLSVLCVFDITCFTRHLRVLLDISSPQTSISAACAVVGLVASANLLFPFPTKPPSQPSVEFS